jgi:hypothetical protein
VIERRRKFKEKEVKIFSSHPLNARRNENYTERDNVIKIIA